MSVFADMIQEDAPDHERRRDEDMSTSGMREVPLADEEVLDRVHAGLTGAVQEMLGVRR